MATEEELKRLPLRAIVAYAARCARRVRPLYRLPDDVHDRERDEAAVSRAITLAEEFADGYRIIARVAAVNTYAVAAAEDARAAGAAAEAAAAAAIKAVFAAAAAGATAA